ncbi:MAG: 3-oxoacyl-ACP reductase family protein [Nitrososphaerales archaeon]|jgi:3-oxoacyl-[acyl-carrier protein] reductase
MSEKGTAVEGGRLAGRVALVTGAGKGIGRAIAEKFAAEGAEVVINYLKSEKQALDLAKSLGRKRGGEAPPPLTVRADVSSAQEVNQMVSQVVSRFGRIDILVNNAAVLYRVPFLEATEEDFDRTMAINLKGTWLCCKAVAPIMLKQKHGRIINISSISGYSGLASAAGVTDYVASKAGVLGLTRSIALALAPHVNVNAICPGTIETDMISSLAPERKRATAEEAPLRSLGEPGYVADAAVFLASDESRWVTGEIVTVAGGRAMR